MRVTASNGPVFDVDDQDVEVVERYSWRIGIGRSQGYPVTTIRTVGGKTQRQTVVKLHQFLLGKAPIGLEWDHIDRNKLNNRRSNLRAVTPTINRRNTAPRRTNKTGVAGVFYYASRRKWHAAIGIGYKILYLGQFATLEEAAQARRVAEVTYWGDRR